MSDNKIPKFDLLRLMQFGRKKSTRDKKYATFNRRMIAATIDSMILMLTAPAFNWLVPINIASLSKYPLDENDPQSSKHFLLYALSDHEFMASWLDNFMAQALFMCFVSAIFWHFWSATPGKMLMRIKIADAATDGPISDKQIVLRAAGYFLSGIVFMMGFFWIGIDKRRQGWHDKLAGTVVIVIPWRKKKNINPVIT